MNRVVSVLLIAGALVLFPHSFCAQDAVKGKLAAVKSIKCIFPLVAASAWTGKDPDVKVKPSNLVQQFNEINTDEGTAKLDSAYGEYDITVRYAEGYLNLIQSFRDGPLWITTIFEKQSSAGKLKAVQSRHELIDIMLSGVTSSPEQYYGECEILK